MYQVEKLALRKECLEKREGTNIQTLTKLSKEVTDLALLYATKFHTVMVYAAFGSEVQTEDLIKRLLAQGKRVCLPKCYKKGIMKAFVIQDFQDLSLGTYGILEPPEIEEVSPDCIDLVFCPGLAFSGDMGRIGYGGGYYDRFLPRCVRALKVGLCYGFALIQKIPMGPYDQRMDAVITEKGVLNKL